MSYLYICFCVKMLVSVGHTLVWWSWYRRRRAGAQEHCWNLNSQLASLNSLNFLRHAAQGRGPGRGPEKSSLVGLRRSLLSREWHRLNREPVELSKWGSGEPAP